MKYKSASILFVLLVAGCNTDGNSSSGSSALLPALIGPPMNCGSSAFLSDGVCVRLR